MAIALQKVFDGFPLLNRSDLDEITAIQKHLFTKFLSHRGSAVYMGENVRYSPGVFPPRPDSVLLAQSMEIPWGASVLDVGVGSGVLSVIAARRMGWTKAGPNTGRIVGTDISSEAIRCSRDNMKRRFGELKGKFEAEEASVFPSSKESYRVIIANLPFTNMPAEAVEQRHQEVAATMWDIDYAAHHALLAGGQSRLESDGVLFMNLPNFPDAQKCLDLIAAHKWGCSVTGIRTWCPDPSLRSNIKVTIACLRLTKSKQTA